MVSPAERSRPVSSREDAEGYVAGICFKHGPPSRLGVELEWTLHHHDAPHRALDRVALAAALGPHAPPTLAPSGPHDPLPRGSRVTVEPGGQVEISSPAYTSLATLLRDVDDDIAALEALLAPAGLARGDSALDPHRLPDRILDVPRYAAMQDAFDAIGPDGSVMMCSTASLQLCVDAGEPHEVATRWHALHALGPALVALFGNSPDSPPHSGSGSWRSARLRSTMATCPPVTEPPAPDGDPAAQWARTAMTAPVLCIRRDGDCWDAPAGLSFGDWADPARRPAGLPRPTYDDLDYHLSTLFPPVRPRGYLEVRYLDTQRGQEWHHPVLLLAALMSAPGVVEAAADLCDRAADRWLAAARRGLDDEPVLEAASAVVELGCAAMGSLDVDRTTRQRTVDALERRITEHAMRRHTA